MITLILIAFGVFGDVHIQQQKHIDPVQQYRNTEELQPAIGVKVYQLTMPGNQLQAQGELPQ